MDSCEAPERKTISDIKKRMKEKRKKRKRNDVLNLSKWHNKSSTSFMKATLRANNTELARALEKARAEVVELQHWKLEMQKERHLLMCEISFLRQTNLEYEQRFATIRESLRSVTTNLLGASNMLSTTLDNCMSPITDQTSYVRASTLSTDDEVGENRKISGPSIYYKKPSLAHKRLKRELSTTHGLPTECHEITEKDNGIIEELLDDQTIRISLPSFYDATDEKVLKDEELIAVKNESQNKTSNHNDKIQWKSNSKLNFSTSFTESTPTLDNIPKTVQTQENIDESRVGTSVKTVSKANSFATFLPLTPKCQTKVSAKTKNKKKHSISEFADNPFKTISKIAHSPQMRNDDENQNTLCKNIQDVAVNQRTKENTNKVNQKEKENQKIDKPGSDVQSKKMASNNNRNDSVDSEILSNDELQFGMFGGCMDKSPELIDEDMEMTVPLNSAIVLGALHMDKKFKKQTIKGNSERHHLATLVSGKMTENCTDEKIDNENAVQKLGTISKITKDRPMSSNTVTEENNEFKEDISHVNTALKGPAGVGKIDNKVSIHKLETKSKIMQNRQAFSSTENEENSEFKEDIPHVKTALKGRTGFGKIDSKVSVHKLGTKSKITQNRQTSSSTENEDDNEFKEDISNVKTTLKKMRKSKPKCRVPKKDIKKPGSVFDISLGDTFSNPSPIRLPKENYIEKTSTKPIEKKENTDKTLRRGTFLLSKSKFSQRISSDSDSEQQKHSSVMSKESVPGHYNKSLSEQYHQLLKKLPNTVGNYTKSDKGDKVLKGHPTDMSEIKNANKISPKTMKKNVKKRATFNIDKVGTEPAKLEDYAERNQSACDGSHMEKKTSTKNANILSPRNSILQHGKENLGSSIESKTLEIKNQECYVQDPYLNSEKKTSLSKKSLNQDDVSAEHKESATVDINNKVSCNEVNSEVVLKNINLKDNKSLQPIPRRIRRGTFNLETKLEEEKNVKIETEEVIDKIMEVIDTNSSDEESCPDSPIQKSRKKVVILESDEEDYRSQKETTATKGSNNTEVITGEIKESEESVISVLDSDEDDGNEQADVQQCNNMQVTSLLNTTKCNKQQDAIDEINDQKECISETDEDDCNVNKDDSVDANKQNVEFTTSSKKNINKKNIPDEEKECISEEQGECISETDEDDCNMNKDTSVDANKQNVEFINSSKKNIDKKNIPGKTTEQKRKECILDVDEDDCDGDISVNEKEKVKFSNKKKVDKKDKPVKTEQRQKGCKLDKGDDDCNAQEVDSANEKKKKVKATTSSKKKVDKDTIPGKAAKQKQTRCILDTDEDNCDYLANEKEKTVKSTTNSKKKVNKENVQVETAQKQKGSILLYTDEGDVQGNDFANEKKKKVKSTTSTKKKLDKENIAEDILQDRKIPNTKEKKKSTKQKPKIYEEEDVDDDATAYEQPVAKKQFKKPVAKVDNKRKSLRLTMQVKKEQGNDNIKKELPCNKQESINQLSTEPPPSMTEPEEEVMPRQRGSRRNGTVVSYKEPSLNSKLRRTDSLSSSPVKKKSRKSKKGSKPPNKQTLSNVTNTIEEEIQ